MQDEQQPEETQGLFEMLKDFIDNLQESTDNESKINGILTIQKSIIELLEAGGNVRSQQNETLFTLDEALQANVKVAIEHDESIIKLNELIIDIATNSSKLAKQVQGLAENAAKIPVVDIDNLLKTLNEHADEINDNAVTIKAIKNELKL